MTAWINRLLCRWVGHDWRLLCTLADNVWEPRLYRCARKGCEQVWG